MCDNCANNDLLNIQSKKEMKADSCLCVQVLKNSLRSKKFINNWAIIIYSFVLKSRFVSQSLLAAVKSRIIKRKLNLFVHRNMVHLGGQMEWKSITWRVLWSIVVQIILLFIQTETVCFVWEFCSNQSIEEFTNIGQIICCDASVFRFSWLW